MIKGADVLAERHTINAGTYEFPGQRLCKFKNIKK